MTDTLGFFCRSARAWQTYSDVYLSFLPSFSLTNTTRSSNTTRLSDTARFRMQQSFALLEVVTTYEVVNPNCRTPRKAG